MEGLNFRRDDAQRGRSLDGWSVVGVPAGAGQTKPMLRPQATLRSLDKGEGAAWRRVWAASRGCGDCRSTI